MIFWKVETLKKKYTARVIAVGSAINVRSHYLGDINRKYYTTL